VSSTTITVSSETKEILRRCGADRESYDHIIRKLIEKAGWEKLDNRWNRILAEDEFIPLDNL